MFWRSRHERDVHGALREFYAEGLDAESFVGRAFALTSRLVPTTLNSQGVLDPRTGELAARFDDSPPGLTEAYAAFGRLMNGYPAFRLDPTVNDGEPYAALDFYGRREFERLEIFDQVYRPMRYTDHCLVHVPARSRSHVFLGLLRDGRPFDEADKATLRELQPHLARGRELAFATTAAASVPLSPDLFTQAGFHPRECDVLFWMTRGKTTDEIAIILRVQAESVSRHLQSVYAKLGVANRVTATIAAIRLARELYAESELVEPESRSFLVRTRGILRRTR